MGLTLFGGGAEATGRFDRVFIAKKNTSWQMTRNVKHTASGCRHKVTVTTGSIFEKTRTPLTTWLEAA